MDGVLNDLTGVMQAVFTSGDWWKIGLVILVGMVGAMTVSSYRQLPGASIFAMMLLAVGTIVFCVLTGTMPTVPSSWGNQLISGWNDLMAMTGSTLVGWFVLFFALIFLFVTIRRLFLR